MMTPYSTSLSHLVDRWCAATPGRTRAELARAIGVHHSQLSRWCSGRAKLHLGTAEWSGLAGTLGLSPAERRGLAIAAGLDPMILVDVRS